MAVTETKDTKATALPSAGGLTLQTDKGITTIADDVVAKIAGHACREHEAVSNLGTQFRRLVGRVKRGEGSLAQGVNVEVGRKEAAIDLVVVVRHGFSIPSLAQEIRESVIAAVESATGLVVVEVNIEVDDIVFEEPAQSRVA
ncbi:MAG: Asp23/Gls24 family envelope stress response protein [Actinobacteria bacterium]|nr:Asp23/Gls24 family envelope stress response protein [Actinomycetota bacterium]